MSLAVQESAALGRKQRITHAQFVDAMKRAPAMISRAHIDGLVGRTLDEIARFTKGKRASFAWSGGKDSQVLRTLAQQAGIADCVLVVTRLEYPAFLAWVREHRPNGLTTVNVGLDLPWLAQHPEMLFPQDAQAAARWIRLVQTAGQNRYCREQRPDILLLGRRTLDGNFIGRRDGLYTSKGVTRYAPLRDWTHEEVFAFLHYHNIPLPPCYGWPRGFEEGTHAWPDRQRCSSVENGWREVYAIDPSIVHGAAAYLPSATAFLQGLVR